MKQNLIIAVLVVIVAALLFFLLYGPKSNSTTNDIAGFRVVQSKLVIGKKEDLYFVLMDDESVKDGPFRQTFPSQRKVVTGQYVQDKRHGIWEETINGTINKIILYNMGEIVGGYDASKGEKLNATDAQGLKTGFYKFRKNRISPFQTGIYRNNQKEGFWIEESAIPFSNYNMVIEGNYVKDKKQGDWKVTYKEREVFSSTGSQKITDKRIEYIFNYIDNKLNAVTCCYPESFDKGNFANGTGVLKTYYPDGKLREVANYKDGLLNGIDITYNSPDLPEFANSYLEKEYQNGIENGAYTFYMSKGQKHIAGSLQNGVIHGIWEFYTQDSLGNNILSAREIYEMGELIRVDDSLENMPKINASDFPG